LAELQEFKCPHCDGGIEFSSGEQKMKCPYCDSEFEIEALMTYQAELDKQYEDNMVWETDTNAWQEGEADGLRVYCCNTCGGEIVADETTGATECPFCGNPVVMTGQFAGTLRPDLVIPFKMDKKAAMATLQNHYKGKVLLPKVFKDENHIKEVKGIYVPVWLFNADADAHVQYKTTKIRHWSDSKYNYTETSHFMVTRAGGLGFEHVPVDGSSKMDDTLMESIEPFHIGDAVDFQTAYLSGYLADKYDVDAAASIGRANERIKRSTEEAFAATVNGYSTVVPVSSNIKLNNSKAKYALFPVWMFNTQWNGKRFTFVINGQTGKIAGDLPMDMGAFWRWLFGVTGAVTAALFVLRYLSWLV
jgi:DNA-directed RNA polymerase subunit RPC12/RpoP